MKPTWSRREKDRGSVTTFFFFLFTVFCYAVLHLPEMTLVILNYKVIHLPSLHRKSRKKTRKRVIRVSAPCVAK